jgi:hypothetical protein
MNKHGRTYDVLQQKPVANLMFRKTAAGLFSLSADGWIKQAYIFIVPSNSVPQITKGGVS